MKYLIFIVDGIKLCQYGFMLYWIVFFCGFYVGIFGKCFFIVFIFWNFFFIEKYILIFQLFFEVFYGFVVILFVSNFFCDFYGFWIKFIQYLFIQSVYFVWVYLVGSEVGKYYFIGFGVIKIFFKRKFRVCFFFSVCFVFVDKL